MGSRVAKILVVVTWSLAVVAACGKADEKKADSPAPVTRAELRAQRGAEAMATVQKALSVLEAAMRVPRAGDGKSFTALQNAIRVKDIVVGWKRAESATANTLLFAMGDVTQEFSRMLDKPLWAAEKSRIRWKDIGLSNKASGFFDLSGVARWLDPDSYYEKDKMGWKVAGGGLLHDLDAMSRLKYVIVMKDMAYKAPKPNSADTFAPGFYLGHALVYRVDDAELVGQFTVHAKSSKGVSGNVDSLRADLKVALKKQIEDKLANSVDEDATIVVPSAAPAAAPPATSTVASATATSALAPAGEGFSVMLPGVAKRSVGKGTITYKLLDPALRLNFILTVATISGAKDKSADALRNEAVASLKNGKSMKDVVVGELTRGGHKGARVDYGLVSSKDPNAITPVKALVYARPPKLYSLYVARLPGGDAKAQDAAQDAALASFQLTP